MTGIGNARFVPGFGYVEPAKQGDAAVAAPLGDDGTVMMISGLGADAVTPTPVSSISLFEQIPWWGWLLIGAALCYAAQKVLEKK